jgi:hypothetical protein
MNNLEKYKKDLNQLIEEGEKLLISIRNDLFPKKDYSDLINHYLPNFKNHYQSWYSEALVLIELILPNRAVDFKKYYEKPKVVKLLNHENYTISHYLQGLSISNDPTIQLSALANFEQQFNILKSCQKRFESSLFDIKQLLQADLFNSELDAAKELNNKGFVRGAGAIAGVVLEHHLSQVCSKHKLQTNKQFPPTINGFNQLLKNSGVIELEKFMNVQFLGALRNLCDHKKSKEPTKEEVDKLIDGVNEVTKTVF